MTDWILGLAFGHNQPWSDGWSLTGLIGVFWFGYGYRDIVAWVRNKRAMRRARRAFLAAVRADQERP
jgi:lipid-A-disaccharide synthase-like uncharacterized protein